MLLLKQARPGTLAEIFRLLSLMLLVTLAAGLGCAHRETTQPVTASAQPEIRAVWVSVLGPGLKSPEEIRQMVDAARRANLNTIVAQVHREGAALFDTRLEPKHAGIVDLPGFDPLAFLLKEAHDTSGGKARLDVYAWFNVFKLGSQRDYLDSVPPPIAVSHPEWFTRDASGEFQTELDPGVPEAQDFVIAVIEDCLKRYPVDGINLDFIRYFGRDRGYNPVALERFHRLTGRTDVPDPKDKQWSDFRRDQTTAFVRRCAISIWTLRPEANFNIDAVGFGRPPLEHFSDTSPYLTVFQDWGGWAEKGYLDMVLRMGYKRERIPEHAQQFRGWADYSRQLMDRSRGRIVTVGIGGYFNPMTDTLNQYREAQKRGLGTCLFSYNRPNQEASKGGKGSFESPLWDTLAREIYPQPVPPPRPVWRSQRAFIAGVLKDSAGKRIDGGEVRLVGTPHGTRSDGSGFFAFVDLEPGMYQLEAPGTPFNGATIKAISGIVTQLDPPLIKKTRR